MSESKELNVRPGDVVLWCSGDMYRIEQLRTVIKVTPTGRIRISDSDKQYDKYGRQMGHRARYESASYIREATEDDVRRATENEIIDEAYRLILRVKKSDLSYDTALQIIKLL